MQIRLESPGDEKVISDLIACAFSTAKHSSGTESAIVGSLRNAGALSLSLVATKAGQIIGHIAFSAITINEKNYDWVGLGPVAVTPCSQGIGVGSALIHEGLSQIRILQQKGCVVLGDPNYYKRFGFRTVCGITYPEVPPEYFMALAWHDPVPQGIVAYHPAFTGEV